MRYAFAPVRLATSAMATRFELVLGGAPAGTLRAAGEAAIDEIEQCHRRFTRFATDSLLCHIMRTAVRQPVRLDADTFALFADALCVHVASGGAFDISVGSDMDRRRGLVDGDRDARSRSDAVVLDAAAHTIRLTSRISLDLGAIAKGHALDLAVRVLRESGVPIALLHGGTSSVAAIGAPPGEPGWRVAVRAHAAPVILLRDRTLSVSVSSHQLVDGRTGGTVPPRRVAAVTGPTARLADAWSTALAVLGVRPVAMGSEWSAWFGRTPEHHGFHAA
jgi:thiamine biosynthesis lipoprotein